MYSSAVWDREDFPGPILTDGTFTTVDFDWVVNGNNETRMTTGFAIKKGKHYDVYQQVTHNVGTTGSLVLSISGKFSKQLCIQRL